MGLAVADDEIHLPFPAATRDLVPLATRFRSTWLTSSLVALRERGRLDEYFARLPKEHHAVVHDSVAGTWLPVAVAAAHYEACDSLHFTQLELIAIGREVHAQVNASVLDLMIKLASGIGLTPWTVFSQFNRLWNRVWMGGGVGVYRIGPKEARLEIVGWPCSRSLYVRHCLRGVIGAMLEVCCSKAYVRDLPHLCSNATLGYRCAWA